MNYLFIMKRVFNWLLISLCTCFSEWKKKLWETTMYKLFISTPNNIRQISGYRQDRIMSASSPYLLRIYKYEAGTDLMRT